MSVLPLLGRVYRWFDASAGRLLPARARLWLKGACLAVARKLMPARLGRSEGVPALLPDWAYAALHEAAKTEPELLPRRLVPYMRRVTVPLGRSRVASGYFRLWERLDPAARHVFVLGDADGGASEFLLSGIKKLVEKEHSRAVVIWTMLSATSKIDLPAKLQQIELENVTGVRDAVEQSIILARVLIEIRPTTIYVASSHAGWAMLRTTAGALSESSHLYAELPSMVTCRHVATFAAEKSVAAGLSKSITLIANSAETVSTWMSLYGIDPATIRLVTNNHKSEGGTGVFVDPGNRLTWLEHLNGFSE